MHALLAAAGLILAQTAPFEMESHRNIAYHDGPDADAVRHRLDIHVPKGQKNFPVLFFIHGGGWVQGNKDQFGMYSLLARTFARHGIATVCPNYRLSPDVLFPEHPKDVARAFAWTHKNIANYGGRADEIFLSGHSAGGHLAALLATDESYLKQHGLGFRDIQGSMPMSGLMIVPNVPAFAPVFGGNDPFVRWQASPLKHVGAKHPPFLILYGDNDLPSCDRPQAQMFYDALKKNGCQASLIEAEKRNHFSIIMNAAKDTDPVFQAMLGFIEARVTVGRLANEGVEGLDRYTRFLARYAGHIAGN